MESADGRCPCKVNVHNLHSVNRKFSGKRWAPVKPARENVTPSLPVASCTNS